jgi:hypothetical protein|tara:strand:- start:63 stop:320 length:258 start_codon:yes stop_codon:yes gene_type:complete
MVSLSQYLEASDILTEDAKDKTRAKKIMQDLSKIEGRFRNKMYKLDEVLNKDMENKNLSKSLRMSYKNNITAFMRDAVSTVKKVK